MSEPKPRRTPEDRRARALRMLKAKPGSPGLREGRQAESRSAKERELDERARELEERARELEDREAALGKKRPSKSRPEEDPVARPGAARESSTRPSRKKSRTTVREKRPSVDNAAQPDPPTKRGGKKAPRAEALLEVQEIDVHYGQIQALRKVSLTIRRGEVVALLGANGAGKSSTLRAISGMVTPSSGQILFDGAPISGLKAHQVVKHGIAHVPEGRELFPTLSVEENLRLGYWPQRTEAGKYKEALDRVLTTFPRLAERRSQAAGTMSGGEQQMLVFGRALMSSPELLLVDEMSLGLAPLIVRTLFEAVDAIYREGKSVIIVEQFVHQALRHAQRASVLSKGEISLEAPSETLRDDPQLLAAYLGGAEGGIEEVAETKPKTRTSSKGKGSSKKKRATSRSKG